MFFLAAIVALIQNFFLKFSFKCWNSLSKFLYLTMNPQFFYCETTFATHSKIVSWDLSFTCSELIKYISLLTFIKNTMPLTYMKSASIVTSYCFFKSFLALSLHLIPLSKILSFLFCLLKHKYLIQKFCPQW